MIELSRDEIEARIQAGEVLVIRKDRVLRLNAWLDHHPGGDIAIRHMVGRNAADEIDVYHGADALETIPKWEIASVCAKDLPWRNFVPPIQGGRFRCREEIAAGGKEISIEDEVASQRRLKAASVLNPRITSAEAKCIDEYNSDQLQKDLEKYPSLDSETQIKIHDEFRSLWRELEADGAFQCNYWGYVREATRISSLILLSAYTFYYYRSNLWLLALSGTFLGLAWHQLVFIAHDSGHLGITHSYFIDTLIGTTIGSYIGGLSLGWWKRNHNVHHLVTNDPVHDPDIQHLPFFAVSASLLGSVYSTFYEKVLTYDCVARVMIKVQQYTYYPILCFGRFNLYRLSWVHLLYGLGPRKGKAGFFRWYELAGLTFFMWWYFYIVVGKLLTTWSQRIVFVMVSHIVTMPVHVQITLSHFAQSTSDLGPAESFPQRQIRTTMDVACPAWLDYIHGGLQFQAIHHLFPRMPRHNFRGVQPKVIAFCERLGLHYTIYGFTRGNKCVIDRLADIAEQAAIFNACNDFCRKEVVGE